MAEEQNRWNRILSALPFHQNKPIFEKTQSCRCENKDSPVELDVLMVDIDRVDAIGQNLFDQLRLLSQGEHMLVRFEQAENQSEQCLKDDDDDDEQKKRTKNK